MKAIVAIMCLIIAALSAAESPADAQGAPPDSRPQSNQRLSHQMNQPPPDPASRTILSNDIIEEIRQLYLQAKKELEQKAATPNKAQ